MITRTDERREALIASVIVILLGIVMCWYFA